MRKSSIAVIILFVLGIGLCIAAFAMGFSGIPTNAFSTFFSHVITRTSSENLQTQQLSGVHTVTQLKLDVDDANCTIQYGDSWALSSTDNDASWSMEGNTLTIEQHEQRQWIHSNAETLVLTVPTGTQLDSMEFDVEAGAVNVSGFTVNGTVLCDLEAGEIIMDNMIVNALTLDVEAGDMNFDGVVKGNINADCDMGAVALNLQNGSTIRYISGKVDLGDFTICVNEKSILEGNGVSRKVNTEVPNAVGNDALTVSCDVGSVDVNIYTDAA